MEVLGPVNTKYYPSITLGNLGYTDVSATMWAFDNEILSLEVQIQLANSSAAACLPKANAYMESLGMTIDYESDGKTYAIM